MDRYCFQRVYDDDMVSLLQSGGSYSGTFLKVDWMVKSIGAMIENSFTIVIRSANDLNKGRDV